ncbi:MAG: hypothetical protein O7B99_14400 [Planctomycetota bacterium]|nr:hypothetical protein [Planctomycetota bacterium]
METVSDPVSVDSWIEFAGTAFFIISALSVLLFTFAFCRIYSKAGYHGAMGVLMLVPVVNVVMLFQLAFSRWPIERELKNLKKVQRAAHKADEQVYKQAA